MRRTGTGTTRPITGRSPVVVLLEHADLDRIRLEAEGMGITGDAYLARLIGQHVDILRQHDALGLYDEALPVRPF
jgi:hypothetical protein